jgi:hypothetical protein
MSDRTAPEREPLLVFVHIQKTAGLTLRKVLQRQYPGTATVRLMPNHFAKESSRETVGALLAAPPRTVRAIHGHMLFWETVEWPGDARLFTVLRDPVDRVISHYYWLRGRKAEAGATLRASLEEAVTDGTIRDNLQTRVLAGADPAGVADRPLLERAIARLDRFAVVGLTERFDATLLLLARTFGWAEPYYERENVNSERPPRSDISRDAIALIESRNALDRELYEHAKARFARDCAAQGPTFELDVGAFQRANKAVVAGERAPRPAPLAGQLDLAELLSEARAESLVGEQVLAGLVDRASTLRSGVAELTTALTQAKQKVELLEARRRLREPMPAAAAAALALEVVEDSPRRRGDDGLSEAERLRRSTGRIRIYDRLVELQDQISELELRLRLADDPDLAAELERLKGRETAALERVGRLEARDAELP